LKRELIITRKLGTRIKGRHDIKNISNIGFEFIHLAEFSWAKLEPEEGQYDFAWLDRVIELSAKYNLKVILGTPTPTFPA